jgi:hypothetical protein
LRHMPRLDVTRDPDIGLQGSNATRTTEFFNSILRFRNEASCRMLETLTR